MTHMYPPPHTHSLWWEALYQGLDSLNNSLFRGFVQQIKVYLGTDFWEPVLDIKLTELGRSDTSRWKVIRDLKACQKRHGRHLRWFQGILIAALFIRDERSLVPWSTPRDRKVCKKRLSTWTNSTPTDEQPVAYIRAFYAARLAKRGLKVPAKVMSKEA